MTLPSSSQLDNHTQFLRQKVFQADSKWPHFGQLIDWIIKLSSELEPSSTVVALERTLMYGGFSLFAPYFSEHDYISFDCSPESAESRGSYNAYMLDDPRCIKVSSSTRTSIYNIDLGINIADLLIVPNLVHHVADQKTLLYEYWRILKPGGLLFIFEPLVRELHQIPDDFLRYTPYGLKYCLEDIGFVLQEMQTSGNVFEVISYCWFQALEYFPEGKKQEMQEWFIKEHLPQLMLWDKDFPSNISREHTSFPMSFVVTAKKPLE